MPSSAETKSLFGLDGLHNGTMTLANTNSTTGTATGTVTHAARGTATHLTRIDISGTLALAASDGSSNGATGFLQLFKFPPGLLKMEGGLGSLTLTAGTNATNFIAAAAAVISLGTSQADTTSTLTAAEANIVQSTAFTMSSRTKSGTIIASGSSNLIDNTVVNSGGTTSYVYLNVAFPGTSATGGAGTTLTVVGWVDVAWKNLSFNEL